MEILVKRLEEASKNIDSNHSFFKNEVDEEGKQMKDEDYNRMLVLNNVVWSLGELAIKIPEYIKPHLVYIVETLAKILNTDISAQLSQKNQNLLDHYARSVAISLGRLGSIDP